jgi:sigma-B regulation protein RsbU (phosphoserine phosphatase)
MIKRFTVSSSPSPEYNPSDRELFDFFLEHIPDQIYFKDRQGRFLRISRAVAEYLNASNPREVIGKSDFDYWNEESAREAAEDERRILETGKAMVGKIDRMTYPNGRVAWDYTTKMPLRDAQGRIIGICGINKDFTRVIEMEQELREDRNQLQVLTDELRKQNAQIEADLDMARELQEALLPGKYEAAPNNGVGSLSFTHYYLPAASVGGDFFHIFPLSEGRTGVFICDVVGRGVRAALIAAVIRTLIEELRSMISNPGRFLGALNLRVRSVLERMEQSFVTKALHLVADPVKGRVLIANAAHPQPVRIQKGKGPVGLSGADEHIKGPKLGRSDEATYRTEIYDFDEGDRIVLFSDGIYKVVSTEGEKFGLKRLMESLRKNADLPADDLFKAVISDVKAFTGKADFDDDVCLFAVERTSS